MKSIWLTGLALVITVIGGWMMHNAAAVEAASLNISTYRDLISTSAPDQLANHTLTFRINTTVNSGGQLLLVPPPGFSVINSSTFAARNVELLVNGSSRPASGVVVPDEDLVEIFPGSPGQIRYTLGSTTPILPGDQIEFRVGNHTSSSIQPSISTSTVTTATTTFVATTTIPGDSPGIRNANATGTQSVRLEVRNGGPIVAFGDFLIALVEQVGVGPIDTRSPFPPELSEGLPEDVVSAVVSGVEVSVRTNKFAYCRYATEPGIDFEDMTREFDRGTDFWVFHTFTVTGVQPEEEYNFYVRCIDLEDNINQEDYLISFRIGEMPTGEPNPDGDEEGDGSGTGDSGSGGGEEGGSGDGQTGDGTGPQPSPGDEPSPGGGSAGGGGGSAGSGGGGSGGGFESQPAPFESGDARIIINGFAFPNSTVTVLVDGQTFTTTNPDNNGRYSVTVDQIARGVYTFGVYATDRNEVRSSTFSTSFTVSGARTSSLSNINIPPSIRVNPDPATPGQAVVFSGYALPNANITIEHEREGSSASRQTFTTTSSATGAWSYEHTLGSGVSGPHRLRVRAQQEGGASTNFSSYARYGVGEELSDTMAADLNRDGRVNLVDFSILLFWWGTDGGDSNPPADINQDGVVNLVDFSILLFNWTG